MRITYPKVTNRNCVYPYELHRGSVVTFETDDPIPRTGIIVMDDRSTMLAALNLYEEEGSVWVMSELPDNIMLYEATEEEKIWGYNYFLSYESGYSDYNGDFFVAIIDQECPRNEDDFYRMRFCKDILSYVPRMTSRAQWKEIKNTLTRKLSQIGGLQFNRYQAEFYCFLTGILMIADYSKDEEARLIRTKLFIKEWEQFSWMYGIGLGRVIGSRLHNFTSVVNQTGNNHRKYYTHLYLPLVEHYFNKIIEYNDDKPDKLRRAIEKVKKIEELEEQKTDLDELFGILFPKHLQDIMSSSRPAHTIAKMRREMEAKEKRIKELEDAVDDLSHRYDEVLAQLTSAVNDVESDKISADELISAFLRFPTELALTLFGNMSALLAMNPTWQKYAPLINEQILGKVNKQQEERREIADNLKKTANKPSLSLNLELVQKKETNIDKNYAPNVEQNGGMLNLSNDYKRNGIQYQE